MDDFERIRELGKGSFGSAILVRRRSDNKQLVIKEVILSSLSQKEIEDARKEANFLAQLNHSNIVRYEGAFERDSKLHILMEFCEGGDMADRLKKQNGVLLEESVITDWFCQISLAVRYCHEKKILHRDIKTSNIFLHRHGKQLKLGDFGIARALDSSADMARTCIGTPYYLSPEICEGKPYNSRSDIWSLGCVLYELCSLRHAFEAANMRSLVMKIVRGQHPPLNPRYSYDLKKVVAECFKRDPSKRPSVNSIIRKPFINAIAIKHEPGLTVKAAPSARSVLAEKQKRSRSPERGRSVASRVSQPKVSKVADAKERERQIHSVYGNQKVIIPRKSKSAQSREERAKKSRDNERDKMLHGIKASIASNRSSVAAAPSSRVSQAQLNQKPAGPSAAEIWENRHKDILKEYYQNKEAALNNKKAVRGDHNNDHNIELREQIQKLEEEKVSAPLILKPSASGEKTPTVPGSPGHHYERTRAKKTALQKLNERRASWALDQPNQPKVDQKVKPPNLSGSGDQLDHPPILSFPQSESPTQSEDPFSAPVSARKMWDAPSKTVVNNFQEMKVDIGSFGEGTIEPNQDSKQPLGDTIVIRSAQSTVKNDKDIQISQIPDNFDLFEAPVNKADNFTSIKDICEKTQESIAPPSIINSEDRKTEKKKGSVLKRLAAKFNPNQRKSEKTYGVDETTDNTPKESNHQNESIPSIAVTNDIKVDVSELIASAAGKTIEETLDDIQIKSMGIDDGTITSTVHSSKPLSTRSSPITIRSQKEHSDCSNQPSEHKSPPSPSHNSNNSNTKHSKTPSPLPKPLIIRSAHSTSRKLTASHSFRLPSPEPSVCSPRVAESPKSMKPLNIRFNRLRVSHSLPDLSRQDGNTEIDQGKVSITLKPTDHEKSEESEKEDDDTEHNKFVPIEPPPPTSHNALFVKPSIPIRSSNDEVFGLMQSLIETGESINVDDIENESKPSSANDSKASTVETDIEEFWDSSESTQNSIIKSLNVFDDLEMKRCKLENELGIQLMVHAYKILSSTFDDTSISTMVQTQMQNLLGEKFDIYYPRIMQLVVQDSITYDQSNL